MFVLGFCGVFIFSLWDRGGNDASIVRAGKNVYTDDFGGEGTGVKSMKLVDWRPNEKVVTTVKGTWDARIQGWKVECTFQIGRTEHFMAEFQRRGEIGMQDDFTFNAKRRYDLDLIILASYGSNWRHDEELILFGIASFN